MIFRAAVEKIILFTSKLILATRLTHLFDIIWIDTLTRLLLIVVGISTFATSHFVNSYLHATLYRPLLDIRLRRTVVLVSPLVPLSQTVLAKLRTKVPNPELDMPETEWDQVGIYIWFFGRL
jgi:hypothetical protein